MDTNFDTGLSMMNVVGAALEASRTGQAVPVSGTGMATPTDA
jgi:hypothetical protein